MPSVISPPQWIKGKGSKASDKGDTGAYGDKGNSDKDSYWNKGGKVDKYSGLEKGTFGDYKGNFKDAGGKGEKGSSWEKGCFSDKGFGDKGKKGSYKDNFEEMGKGEFVDEGSFGGKGKFGEFNGKGCKGNKDMSSGKDVTTFSFGEGDSSANIVPEEDSWEAETADVPDTMTSSDNNVFKSEPDEFISNLNSSGDESFGGLPGKDDFQGKKGKFDSGFEKGKPMEKGAFGDKGGKGDKGFFSMKGGCLEDGLMGKCGKGDKGCLGGKGFFADKGFGKDKGCFGKKGDKMAFGEKGACGDKGFFGKGFKGDKGMKNLPFPQMVPPVPTPPPATSDAIVPMPPPKVSDVVPPPPPVLLGLPGTGPALGPGAQPPPPPMPPPPGLDELSGNVIPLTSAQLADAGALGQFNPLGQLDPLSAHILQAGLLQAAMAPPAAPPGPPPGLPPEIVEQLRKTMMQVEGTSGKVCHFSKSCKKLDCADQHPQGRYIEDDPESLVCRFGRKCKRGQCFYVHPAGRELDEDPSKGQCKLGKDCAKAECIFAHPEGRVSIIQLKCHSCGEVGHIQRECPKNIDARLCRGCGQAGHLQRDCPLGPGDRRRLPSGTYVTMSGFSDQWTSQDKDKLGELVAAELEVFGSLVAPPEILDDGRRAMAAFADPELARQAVQELNGTVFTIEFCSAPLANADFANEDEGCLIVKGFPLRWSSGDLSTLLRGAVNSKTPVLGLDVMPADEDATTGTARVQFQSLSDARRACEDLQGQKVAGKPLTFIVEGGNDDSDDDRVRRRRRSRSRSRGNRMALDNGDYYRRGGDNFAPITIHIDELDMPRRPDVEPCKQDVEVYVDPLPHDDELTSWLSAFGKEEDVFRLPDPVTGRPSRKGYIKFQDHAAARKCVEAGAKWSESERTITSQNSSRHVGGSNDSAYKESVVAKILGPRGEMINRLKEEIGASMLILRGEGLGENERMTSRRVHFVCKAPPEVREKLKAALERRMEDIHDELKRGSNPVQSRRERSRSRNNQRQPQKRRKKKGSRSRSPPPGFQNPGEAPPHMWPPPPGPPGFYPPPGHPGYYPPPPGHPGFYPPPPGHPGFMHPPEGHPWPPPPWMHPDAPPPGAWSAPPQGFHPPVAAQTEPGANEQPDKEPEKLAIADEPPPGNFNAPPPNQHPALPSTAPAPDPEPSKPVEMNSGPDNFFASLPSTLTPEEQDLAESVVAFLRSWSEKKDAGKAPNLIHLGADKHVRECKIKAMPPEVALRAWLERRATNQVSLVRDGKQISIQLKSS